LKKEGVISMVIKLAEKRKGFVPNVNYDFDPPIEAMCILSGDKDGWAQKKFPRGWCIKYENGEGVFQGKPVGEKLEYFFKVTYGSGGSVAVDKGSPSQS
jgi:hypothetical protein